MTDNETFVLKAFLDLLRSAGVSKWSGNAPGLDQGEVEHWSVEFFPPQPERSGLGIASSFMAMESPEPLPKPEEVIPACPCGHSLPEHGAHGFCFLGCSPAQCVGLQKEATP